MKIIKKDLGKKRLFPFLGRFSPKIKKTETFYQKKVGPQKIIQNYEFNSRHYEGTLNEREEKAYRHAKQYEKLYKELIKQGVYPEGTTIKTKKQRHSHTYVLEMFMPKVRQIHPEYLYSTWQSNEISGNVPSAKLIRLKQSRDIIKSKIVRIIGKYGFDYEQMHEDPNHLRNYGIDKKGKLKYFDTEILSDEFPLKQEKSLEKKLLTSIIISTFTTLIFCITSNITGNIINNSLNKPIQIGGLISFLILIISLILWIKLKKERTYSEKKL
jgi:hypothetical protein